MGSDSALSTLRPLTQNWNTVQEDGFFLPPDQVEKVPDDFVQYTGTLTVQNASIVPIMEESIQYSQGWGDAGNMADVPGIVETEKVLELSREETQDLGLVGAGAWA